MAWGGQRGRELQRRIRRLQWTRCKAGSSSVGENCDGIRTLDLNLGKRGIDAFRDFIGLANITSRYICPRNSGEGESRSRLPEDNRISQSHVESVENDLKQTKSLCQYKVRRARPAGNMARISR